jgi:hypothetical protein
MGKGIRFLIPIPFSWLLPHGGMGTIRGMEPLPPRLGRPSRCSEQRVPWMGLRPQGATPVRGYARAGRRLRQEQRHWGRGPPRTPEAAICTKPAAAGMAVGHRLASLGSSSPGAVRRMKQRCAGEALRGRAQRAPRWKRFRRPRRWSRAGRSRARAPPPPVGSVPAATAGPWLRTSQAFALKPEGESGGPGLKRQMVVAPRCIEGAAGSSRPHVDRQGKGVAAAVVLGPWARIHH